MKSILMPCLSPLWAQELEIAQRHDDDDMIRLGHSGKHVQRRQAEHAFLGYRCAVIETTFRGWRLVDSRSPGGAGVIFRDQSCDELVQASLDWYRAMPYHRELVVAFIVPNKQDEFQTALNRYIRLIF